MSSRTPPALSWAVTSATPASGRIGRAVAPAARIACTATAKLAASWTKTPAVSPVARPRRLRPRAGAPMVHPDPQPSPGLREDAGGLPGGRAASAEAAGSRADGPAEPRPRGHGAVHG